MEYQLCPSILAADFWRLGEEIDQVEKAGVKWLHIDIMDGRFVPTISMGVPVVASLRKYTNLFFDVHIMAEEPAHLIKEFAPTMIFVEHDIAFRNTVATKTVCL